MRHEFDNGKYTVIFDEKTGKMEALRYGDPWQDLCGNKMVYCMLAEVDNLKKQRAELLEALKELICGYENTTATGFMDMCVIGDDVIRAAKVIKKCESQ